MQIELDDVQNILSWIKEQLHLNSLSNKSKSRKVKRGEIYICNFGYGIGSEIQKERPCVILQNNIRNYNSETVIVAPITHTNKSLPCMAEITAQFNLDGYVNVSHIQTVSKSRLGNYVSKLSTSDIKKVNTAIYDTIGLMSEQKDWERKLQDKLSYIEKIKLDRNKAQDELKTIYTLTNTANIDEFIKYFNSRNK